MHQITTISQLGARLSVAQLHVKLLRESSANDMVNHILYIVDPANTRLQVWARSLSGPFSVYDRTDNIWTDFSRRGIPRFGGDLNYDFLIRQPEVGRTFVTLHDDTLIKRDDVWPVIADLMRDYHFGGYLDTRNIPQYRKIKLDGVPIDQLRVGTWFCFGRTEHYRTRGYTMGDYRNYFVWSLYAKYRSRRISVTSPRVWLNGGFDLNLRARLAGDRFYVFGGDAPYAEHWTKVTGFFERRGMIPFVDTTGEVDRWREHFRALWRTDRTQFDFDWRYLARLAETLANHGIEDDFLNRDQLNLVRESVTGRSYDAIPS